MPRRTRETSGDHHSDDERDALVSTKRRFKRRRVDAGAYFKPRGLVEVVQEGDKKFIRKLFRFLQSEQLFALSFTCRVIRTFLRADDAAVLWRRARKNTPGPSPPRCPPGMSEMAWTELLFIRKCNYCWTKTTREVDWGLRRRFCSECQKNHVKSQVLMPKTYKDVSEDIFRLVPYSRVARSGVKTQYYWTPELDEVYRKLKRLDGRVTAGKSDAKEQRVSYISDRKRYVDEVLDAVAECERWQEECKARREEAQAELRARVVAKFVELGYAQNDVEDVLRDVTITQSSVFGWTNFLKKHRITLDERRPPLVAATSVGLLRTQYREFLKTRATRGWETLVPFGDIVSLPEVRSSLLQLTPDNTAALVKRIPPIVDTWREDVEVDLLKTLPSPPKSVRRVDAYDPERLKLASSLWRRAEDPTPLTYPNMLVVPHVLSLEYGELKYATADGPWSARGLEYDGIGANVVREFCRMASLNYSTATVALLDDSSMRLQCKLCSDLWPLVLTWRQAIKHLHGSHAGNGTGSWKPFPSSIDEPVAALESELPIWVCTVSLCTRSRTQRSMEDMERHLNDKHSVSHPVKGVHYARTLTAPLSEPLNLFELYAELGDDGYVCRTCEYSSSTSSMLVHLRTQHDAHLRQISGAETSANSSRRSTSPVHGRKRAISISSSSSHDPAPALKKRALFIESTPPAESPRPASIALPPEHVDDHDELSLTEGANETPSVYIEPDNAVFEGSSSSGSDGEDISVDVLADLSHVTRPPSTIASADKRKMYVCKHCTRTVDRFRTMPMAGVHAHLVSRHHIVDPSFDTDYAELDFRTDEQPDVVPWCTAAVYTCLRCPKQTQRFRWAGIDYHLALKHKVVDPVARVDYDRPADDGNPAARLLAAEPPQVTNNEVELRPQTSIRNAPVLDPSKRRKMIAASRTHVCRALGITDFDLPWKGFKCISCADSREFAISDLISHIYAKHGVAAASFGTHFMVSAARSEDIRGGIATSRFSCNLCHSTKTFYMSGLLGHMRFRHKATNPLRNRDYEVADSDPNGDGIEPEATVESDADVANVETDDFGEYAATGHLSSGDGSDVGSSSETSPTDAGQHDKPSLLKIKEDIRNVLCLETTYPIIPWRQCFMCVACMGGISFTLIDILNHLRGHRIDIPKFGRDYDLIARRQKEMRLAFASHLGSNPKITMCNHLCVHCGVFSVAFSLKGVLAHLKSQHNIESEFAAHYFDLSHAKASESIDNGEQRTTKARKIRLSAPAQSTSSSTGIQATRYFCKMCINNWTEFNLQEVKTHVVSKHGIEAASYGEHYARVRG